MDEDDVIERMMKEALDEILEKDPSLIFSSGSYIPVAQVIMLMTMPQMARRANIILLMVMEFYNTYGEDETRKLVSHLTESFERAMEDEIEE